MVCIFQNLIINGNFDIWQRATSYTHNGNGNAYFTADRWYHSGNYSGSVVTVSRQDFVPGQTEVPGEPAHFLRVERTVTGSGPVGVSNRTEDVRTLAGQMAGLYFWARSLEGASIRLIFHQDFGTGGSPSAIADIIPTTQIDLTPNWTRYDFLAEFPSLAGKTIGTDGNSRIGPSFQLLAESGNASFDLARVAILKGDWTGLMDPFFPRTIGEELALCQRYYWRGQALGAGAAFGYSEANQTAMAAAVGKYPVTMRVVPQVKIVTPPTYDACSNGANGGIYAEDREGFVHFVNKDGSDGRYRAWGGLYEANAEIW